MGELPTLLVDVCEADIHKRLDDDDNDSGDQQSEKEIASAAATTGKLS